MTDDLSETTYTELVAEVRRLRAVIGEQVTLNLQLADRLAACSAVLGRAAERGRVCACSTPGVVYDSGEGVSE